MKQNFFFAFEYIIPHYASPALKQMLLLQLHCFVVLLDHPLRCGSCHGVFCINKEESFSNNTLIVMPLLSATSRYLPEVK